VGGMDGWVGREGGDVAVYEPSTFIGLRGEKGGV
jgi:hypothetical protein